MIESVFFFIFRMESIVGMILIRVFVWLVFVNFVVYFFRVFNVVSLIFVELFFVGVINIFDNCDIICF